MSHIVNGNLEMGSNEIDIAKTLNGNLSQASHELSREYTQDNIEFFADFFGGEDFENDFKDTLDKISNKCQDILNGNE